MGPCAGAFGFVFSPDGSKIRFTSPNGKLWEMTSQGTNLHEIIPNLRNSVSRCCGRWTPDGDFYIFTSVSSVNNPQNSFQIWALDERHGLRPPSAEPIQLTSGPIYWEPWSYPSKDGKKIFATGFTLRGELTRFEKKTGRPEVFLGGMSADMADFSRDGEFLTYVSFPDRTLWRSNRDGTGRQILAQFPYEFPSNPRWSPDARQIVYSSPAPQLGVPGNSISAMFIISSQGGTPSRLLPDDTDDEGDPTWSPDGKELVFGHGNNSRGRVEIEILDLESHKRTPLPHGPYPAFSPRWSPDGRYIACEAYLDRASTGLEVYDIKTRRWRVLVNHGSVNWPSWSHDSHSIYYLDGLGNHFSISRIAANGGAPQNIVDLKDFRTKGFWGFWLGLDPDDNPLLLRDAGTNEVYALTLERK
jgi:Tol biopolymer transport system component